MKYAMDDAQRRIAEKRRLVFQRVNFEDRVR